MVKRAENVRWMSALSQELARLIARYRWLQRSIADAPDAKLAGAGDKSSVDETIHSIFFEIVRFKTDDPRIAVRQIGFLLDAMTEPDLDADLRFLLRDEAMAHITRLFETLAGQHVEASITP
jgi:hypothetical protein